MGRIYCLTWLVVLFLLSLNKFLNYFQRKRKRMWKCNIRISKRFLTYQLIVNCMQRINCIHVSSVSGEQSNKTAKWRMFLVQRYQKVPKSLGNSGKFRKKFSPFTSRHLGLFFIDSQPAEWCFFGTFRYFQKFSSYNPSLKCYVVLNRFS